MRFLGAAFAKFFVLFEKKAARSLLGLAPYFAPFLLLQLPVTPEGLTTYLSRYIAFLLLFSVWWNMLRAARSYTAQQAAHKASGKSGKASKRSWPFFYLVVSIFLTLFAIHYFRIKFERPAFMTALVGMGLRALIELFAQKGYGRISLLAHFLYLTDVGYVAFQMREFNWEWQTLLFSTGIALAVMFPIWAEKLAADVADDKPLTKGQLQMLTLLGFSAPTCLVLLVFFGHLTRIYFAAYLVLPLCNQLVSACRRGLDKAELPDFFLAKTTGISYLFLAIIPVASFLCGYFQLCM